MEGSNVSIACFKLRRRFGDFFDPRELHADQYHVEKLVLAKDGEWVCPKCGATSGYRRPPYATSLDDGLRGQNSFVNPLHRAFHTNPIRIPRRNEGVISKAAVIAAEFGHGVGGSYCKRPSRALKRCASPTAGTSSPRRSPPR